MVKMQTLNVHYTKGNHVKILTLQLQFCLLIRKKKKKKKNPQTECPSWVPWDLLLLLMKLDALQIKNARSGVGLSQAYNLRTTIPLSLNDVFTLYSAVCETNKQTNTLTNKQTTILVFIAKFETKATARACEPLTGGNWQKWKRVFLTCPCHKIYRDEAVGLKSCKNTWKITKSVKMGNLGQYHENLIFCQ